MLIKNHQEIKEKNNSISAEQRLLERNTKTPQVFADQPDEWSGSALGIEDYSQEQGLSLGCTAEPNNMMEKTALQICFTASKVAYLLSSLPLWQELLSWRNGYLLIAQELLAIFLHQ